MAKKRVADAEKDAKDGKKKAKTTVTFSTGQISTTAIMKQEMSSTSVLFLERLLSSGGNDGAIVDLFHNVYVKLNFRSLNKSQIPTDRVTVANLSDFLGLVASKKLKPAWFLINPLLSMLDVIRTMTTMFYAKATFAILLPARYLFIEHFSVMFSKFGIEVNCMFPTPKNGEAMAWFVRNINRDDGQVRVRHVYDRSLLEYTGEQLDESDNCVFVGSPVEEESDVDGVSDTESLGVDFNVSLTDVNAQETQKPVCTRKAKNVTAKKAAATPTVATYEHGHEESGFETFEELEEGEVNDKTVDF